MDEVRASSISKDHTIVENGRVPASWPASEIDDGTVVL